MKGLLTDRLLRALKRDPPPRRALCWDTVAPGFCAIATPAGKITFAVIRRLPGGKTPLTRRGGDYPIVTLAAGREWARVTLQDMIGGIDPKAREEAARKAETRRLANSFAALAEDFIDRHVSRLRTPPRIDRRMGRQACHGYFPRRHYRCRRAPGRCGQAPCRASASRVHEKTVLLGPSRGAPRGSKARHVTGYQPAA